VHGASKQIRAPWNSVPITSKWFSELYAAHIALADALNVLERRRAEA
jgi:hypothetical protein